MWLCFVVVCYLCVLLVYVDCFFCLCVVGSSLFVVDAAGCWLLFDVVVCCLLSVDCCCNVGVVVRVVAC